MFECNYMYEFMNVRDSEDYSDSERIKYLREDFNKLNSFIEKIDRCNQMINNMAGLTYEELSPEEKDFLDNHADKILGDNINIYLIEKEFTDELDKNLFVMDDAHTVNFLFSMIEREDGTLEDGIALAQYLGSSLEREDVRDMIDVILVEIEECLNELEHYQTLDEVIEQAEEKSKMNKTVEQIKRERG